MGVFRIYSRNQNKQVYGISNRPYGIRGDATGKIVKEFCKRKEVLQEEVKRRLRLCGLLPRERK